MTVIDAFTVLLGPVLTTALAVDLGLKLKKSDDISKKIAAVQRQTETLQRRQIEAWTRLQRRSVAGGVQVYARTQRRCMSTIPDLERPDFGDMEALVEQELTSRETETSQPAPPIRSTAVNATEEQRTAVQRYDRLVATRLAMQLMLQLKTGRSTKYAGFIDETIQKPFEVNVNLNILIREQDRITKEMRSVGIEALPWDISQPQDFLKRKDQVTTELVHLSKQYRRGEVGLVNYVLSYADLIAEYKVGPTNRGYVEMMRAFHVTNWRVLSSFAESAIWYGKTTLSDYDIAAMLFRHASDMDALRLHSLKQSLPKDSRWPKALNPWIEVRINDMRLSIPSSRNPYLIAALIRASLFCNQSGEAEAYAAVFLQVDEYNKWHAYPNLKYIISSAFLQYYSLLASWSRGLSWVQLACEWTQQLVETVPALVGRLALRILDFCLACDRNEEYEFVLNAVVDCNIEPAELDQTRPINVSPRMMQIRHEWAERAKMKGDATFGDRYVPFRPLEGQKFVSTMNEYFSNPERRPVLSHLDNYVAYEGPRLVAQLQPGSRFSAGRTTMRESSQPQEVARPEKQEPTTREAGPRVPLKQTFTIGEKLAMHRTEESPLFPQDMPWQSFGSSRLEEKSKTVDWQQLGVPVQGSVEEPESETERKRAAAAAG